MNKLNFLKTKYRFNLFILLIIGIIFLTAMPNVFVSADDIATSSDTTSGIGGYSITLPEEGTSYSVNLSLTHKYADDTYVSNSSDEVYYVLVTNANGTTNNELSAYYKFAAGTNSSTWHPELAVTIANIPAGSTVLVENIAVEKNEVDVWGTPLSTNYSYSYMQTNITDEVDSSNIVLVNDTVSMKPLIVGETVAQTCQNNVDTSFDRVTNDTLLSLSGYSSYDSFDFLTYLLSAYNVVSLDEIHSTHIVGPIISQNIAERTTENGSVTGFLAASDYSSGVSSYVGEFTSYGSSEGTLVGVQFNYWFDLDQNENFAKPYAYSEETRLSIDVQGNVNNLQDYYVLLDDTYVLSANDYGYTQTYQNDNFIDFTTLEKALQNVSEDILESGNAENYDEYITFVFDTDGTLSGSVVKVYENYGEDLVVEITYNNGATYDGRDFASFVSYESYFYQGTNLRLTINMEESWTILNATNLVEVNMILPDDYDYYDNPYLLPTTINFACEYINPIDYWLDIDEDGTYEWVTHSQMPYTLINGYEFTESYGEDGEYGEVGNKIIWNMPYVETNSATGDNRLTVAYASSHNIAGHIVAPSAEFWNYDTNGNWLGGNLNGTAIVKSFYSGIMEMHMWAYDGLAEQAVVYGADVFKTVNGTTATREYTFLLDVVYEEDGSIPDGIMNNNFPMVASSSIDSSDAGLAKFSSIAFNEVGTYSFIIYEDTTINIGTDNVIFDLTQYRLDISVTSYQDDDTTVYEISSEKKYRIVDSDGNTLETPELIEEVYGEYEFTFNNITSEEGTVNLTLYKECTTGHVISGAKFYVTEMNSDGTEVLTNGYFERVVSDADGKINIIGLEKGTYYKLEEYETSAGHVLGEGYWIIYINSSGFLGSITAVDGAVEVGSDLVITNEPDTWSVLEITLTKSNEKLEILSDVEFRLQRVIVDSSGTPNTVVGGYDETYITDENGSITIEDLEADQVYMLTETTTPEGHKTHTGYWLIEVSGNSLIPSDPLTYTITEYDKYNKVVSVITDDVILNDLIDYTLPNTGGFGTTAFTITGIVLISVSATLMYYKIKTKNKKIIKARVSK